MILNKHMFPQMLIYQKVEKQWYIIVLYGILISPKQRETSKWPKFDNWSRFKLNDNHTLKYNFITDVIA